LADTIEIESIPLLGVRVDDVTMESALRIIERFVQEGEPRQVVTLDASMCVMAQSDADLRKIVLNAGLVTPDSAGVLWACRRKGHPLGGRVSGVEIVEKLCERSAGSGHSLFFLGSAPGVAGLAAGAMSHKYPGCRIVGVNDGFFGPDQEPEIINRIKSAATDVLCVAMGIPKQEKWIARNMQSLGVPVLIGVGGTFDVLSGGVKRAPSWMQKANVEWLYRLFKNPRKFRKTLSLPKFAMLVLRDRGR